MNAIADYLKVCETAVRSAGATVQQWIGRTTVRHKGPADLVTEADLASQEIIRRTVLGSFPDHCLLAEEDDPAADRTCRGEFRWIADPLDGTTNYVHRVPHYAVSLALEHRGQILVGAVYNPAADECFTAALGQGAFLNGRPMRTSRVSDLAEALAATGFPTQITPASPELRVFNRAIFACQAIRRSGSASLNLCYLAAGRYDVLWAFSTKPWDVAAGALLVCEAGGVITSPDGGKFILDEARYIAAASEGLHAQMVALVGDALS